MSGSYTAVLYQNDERYDHEIFTICSAKASAIGIFRFFPKFERGHPDRQRAEMAGVNRIGDFQLINRRISETVQDSAKVTINHY